MPNGLLMEGVCHMSDRMLESHSPLPSRREAQTRGMQEETPDEFFSQAAQQLRCEQAARAEAEAAYQRLYDVLMKAPAAICVVRGPEHVFELANPLRRQIAGNRE